MSKPTHIIDKLRNPRTRVYLPEILAAMSDEIKEGNRDTAISLLQKYNEKNQEHANRLRDYMQSLYDSRVKLDLPDIPPPFDNTQYIDFDFAPLTLEKAMQRLKYFVAGHSAYIEKTSRRELMFIQTLEALHKADAELYISILLKKFPVETYPGLGIELFNEAVPQYFTSIDVESIAVKEKPDYPEKAKAVDNILSAIIGLAESPEDVAESDEVEVKTPAKKPTVKPKAPVKKPATKKTPATGKASTTAKKAPVKKAPVKKKGV